MDYWTYDEYIAFREGIKDKPLAYICFQVLYWTGMREGELLALTADIDLVAKQIDINKTYQRLNGQDIITPPKTKKSKRRVPIPDFLCQELQSYIDTRYMLSPNERLFPATKHFLSHEMERGSKKTGVKRIRIHDIRHSHLFPHKQQELVTNLEQLAANAPVTPTPEPPIGNPLLDTLGATAGNVIPMPQRKAI